MVLPDEDGPNSLLKSTLMVRTFPSTFISTFFMMSWFFPKLIDAICRRHWPRQRCHWLTEPEKGFGVLSQFAPARSV
jgi:hypothetical protein